MGDIHQTLLYEVCLDITVTRCEHPDGNLQLLYKTAWHLLYTEQVERPLMGRVVCLRSHIHQKFPRFMGSPEDVEELKKYLHQEGN